MAIDNAAKRLSARQCPFGSMPYPTGSIDKLDRRQIQGLYRKVEHVIGAPHVVSITTTTVVIEWDAVPGATSYNIYTSTNMGGPFTVTDNVEDPEVTITDSGGLDFPFYVKITPVFNTDEGNSATGVIMLDYHPPVDSPDPTDNYLSLLVLGFFD